MNWRQPRYRYACGAQAGTGRITRLHSWAWPWVGLVVAAAQQVTVPKAWSCLYVHRKDVCMLYFSSRASMMGRECSSSCCNRSHVGCFSRIPLRFCLCVFLFFVQYHGPPTKDHGYIHEVGTQNSRNLFFAWLRCKTHGPTNQNMTPPLILLPSPSALPLEVVPTQALATEHYKPRPLFFWKLHRSSFSEVECCNSQ